MQLQPFAFFLLLSALITLITSAVAWRRSTPGSFVLGSVLISMTIWSGAYAMRLFNTPAEQKIAWFNVMYIGIITLPNLFLVFILQLTQNDRWLTRRNIVLLFVQPVISLLLLWTNNFHHLYYESIKAIEVNGAILFESVRGPWYFVNMTYSYAAILLALAIMFYSALRMGPLFRNQHRLILIGSVIPWASSILSELNFTAFHGFDLTPAAFGISGILFAFAILRARFMDLIPVARSALIENMSDGVLMLDAKNRVVDYNSAMKTFLGDEPASLLGRHVTELLGEWFEYSHSLTSDSPSQIELRIPNDPSRYLDLRVTPLYDAYRQVSGRLFVFRDVTERKDVEKKLRHANRRLQDQLIEIGILQSQLREQAIRDPLTDLFNRRYLEETLDREIARAAREKYPICVVMIDIDHFKQVNDTYGHEAGDAMLKSVAGLLAANSRRGDFACRYGGEEFLLVMPNIHMAVAYARTETLRASLNALQVQYGNYVLSATFSMGIACFPAHGENRESLLRAVDKAMYAAKEAGRDHIRSYDELEMIEE